MELLEAVVVFVLAIALFVGERAGGDGYDSHAAVMPTTQNNTSMHQTQENNTNNLNQIKTSTLFHHPSSPSSPSPSYRRQSLLLVRKDCSSILLLPLTPSSLSFSMTTDSSRQKSLQWRKMCLFAGLLLDESSSSALELTS